MLVSILHIDTFKLCLCKITQNVHKKRIAKSTLLKTKPQIKF